MLSHRTQLYKKGADAYRRVDPRTQLTQPGKGGAAEVDGVNPSQQRLRRSSVAAALQPRTQLVVFVASLLEVLLAAPRGETRRHLEGGRELLLPRSIISVAETNKGQTVFCFLAKYCLYLGMLCTLRARATLGYREKKKFPR